MTSESENNASPDWALPTFNFSVTINNQESSFQEVTGLDVESQIIEYKRQNSAQFSPVKMPGILKTGNITLKKGVFVKDNTFWDWYAKIKTNSVKRETVVIKLLDETGASIMTWTLQNAWPVKITSTDLKTEGNEAAVESLEIAHEGITVANSK